VCVCVCVCVCACVCVCVCVGAAAVFEARIVEYREEMTELSSSLRQNMKNVRKKIKEFIVESGGFHADVVKTSFCTFFHFK